MATSISKAQAKLLADNFLDSIGSKEDFKPKNSLSALFEVAGFLIETAQKNLNKADRVSSGALSESMKVLNPERRGKIIVIDIELLYYYIFHDLGVRGTKKGSGKFAFKNDFPSKKMVKSIQRWLRKEGLKAKTDVGGKPITKREAKRKSISDATKGAAYAIARSVKQKGIKKTLFWTNAIKATERKAEQELGDAFVVDVLDAIPSKL
jgi:hypothetical protein